MGSKLLRVIAWLPFLLLATIAVGEDRVAKPDPAVAPPMIPELSWEERSDWINVKTAVQPPARGDGVADDTAAIQAALGRIADGVTVYFPPGTYRVTRTLQSPPGRFLGVTLLGHGRSTVLAWDGDAGGRMFWTADGMPYSRYVGLTWDGRGKAAVGFDHSCRKVFETEIRHQHEAYRDFTEAGIRVGHETAIATAETSYENCLFERCGHGVLLQSFNVLDHTFDGCEFRRCQVGLFGSPGTNFYVRNSHFERNTEADIVCRGEQGSSVRRCTSQGSNRFLTFSSSVGPLTLQDCHVDAWTGPVEAVSLGGAPVLMFDCVFTNPPGSQPAVRTARAEQRLIVSNNRTTGSAPVVRTPAGGKVIEIPAGSQGGVVRSASRSFLKGHVRAAGKVFDARRDFGAKGDGVADDTAAIVKAIGAARAHGKGAIAYLPHGQYAVTDTLRLTGGDYALGGSGFRTGLLWKGKGGGTTIEVREPDRITLENISVGHHDFAVGDNAIDILQVGSGKPSSMSYDRVWVWGMYQNKPLDRGLRLAGLGKHDEVHFREVNGNLRITDSARATVYLGLSYEGTLLVEGKSPDRDGFLGGSVRLGTVTDPALWIKDNHSIVMSDLYAESSLHLVRMEGGPSLPAGRVTLQGAKFELIAGSQNNGTEVRDYRGELVLGPYQFYVANPVHHFVQSGDSPFALTLLGGLFYNSRPAFQLSPSARLAVVGCESVVNTNHVVGQAPGVEETPLLEALPRIARGLDDLRRLGAVDVSINHPEKADP